MDWIVYLLDNLDPQGKVENILEIDQKHEPKIIYEPKMGCDRKIIFKFAKN